MFHASMARQERNPAKKPPATTPFNFLILSLGSGSLVIVGQADAIRVEPMVVFAAEMAILLVMFLAGFGAYRLYRKKKN